MERTLSQYELKPRISIEEYELLQQKANELGTCVFMQTWRGHRSIVPAHLFIPVAENKKKIDFVCWPTRKQ